MLCAEAIAADRQRPSGFRYLRPMSTRRPSPSLAAVFIRESIEMDVSPERLSRFFVKEDRGYRVSRGAARRGCFRGPGSSRRSAFLAAGHGLLPEPAHLLAARRTGEGSAAIPLRVAGRRQSSSSGAPKRPTDWTLASSRFRRPSGSITPCPHSTAWPPAVGPRAKADAETARAAQPTICPRNGEGNCGNRPAGARSPAK